uniref:bacterial Ig-like domain-containing protein n=1 Tax=[Lactobacillus] rogosae TaxID=706562 RepID=UPI003FEFA75C
VKVAENMVAYNTDKIGNSEATVKIGDITEKFAFTVVAKTLTEIKVVNAPSKGTYLEGQKFDSTGLSVQAVYNNGTTEDITEAIKHSDIDTAKAGTKTVTVTYKGKTATFTVEVKTRDAVDAFNKSVTDLLNKDITKDDIETVKKLRADYEAMSDAEKEECDIKGLTKLEESVNKILEEENKATEDSKDETGNTTTPSSNSESTSGVKTGDAVNMYVYIMIALLAVLTAACTVPYVRKNRK